MSVEINIKRVLVRTGLGVLSMGSILSVLGFAEEQGIVQRQKAEATFVDFLTGGSFDIRDMSKLDEGTFRVVIRRPDGLTRYPISDDKINEIADHVFGNALRAVREQTGCQVNNVSRMDAPSRYPQFGTFTVTTRC